MSAILSFLRDEDGPTAVEYAVMLALILAVVVVAVTAVGTNTSAMFNDSADQLDAIVTP